MADAYLTQSTRTNAVPAKIPFFVLEEKTGRYRARRTLSPEQIIRAAKRIAQAQFDGLDCITSPNTARDFLTLYLFGRKAEVFCCLFLDNRHRVLAFRELFHGTIDGASVHPREIARACLDLNAAAVIFAHNHPSGTLKPSRTDIAITKKLVNTMDLIDVRVLDHFVIGAGESASFLELGLLPATNLPGPTAQT